MLEVRSVETAGGKNECLLKKLVDGKLQWTSKVEGTPACCSANLSYSAVATISGELFIFGEHGQLLVAPIQLALPVAYLSFSSGKSSFLLAALCNASVFVWNVNTLVAVVAHVVVDPIIALINSEGKEEGEALPRPRVGFHLSGTQRIYTPHSYVL